MVAGDLAEQVPEAVRRVRAVAGRPRRGLAHRVGRAEVAELVGAARRDHAGPWITHQEEETRALGERLAHDLGPRGRCLLFGEMASGKTVLAQGIARGLGIDVREVQSPSFTLVREHSGSGGRLVHVDLHRLEPRDLDGLGLEDLLQADAVVVVEWAERIPDSLRAGARCFRLERLADGAHRISEIAPARV
jgi:tRNA threonylcarbamoyladenosine biosynthesis protein TsaE